MGGREFAAGALHNLKYPTANESSLSAKELESGTVMSLQTRGKHDGGPFAGLRLLHLIYNTTREANDWPQMYSAAGR